MPCICAEVRAQLAGVTSLFLVGSEAQTQAHHGVQPELCPTLSACQPVKWASVYFILVSFPFAHFIFSGPTK